MVDVLVVGSVALDSIKTPFGRVERALGGSAVYASLAAGLFCQPGIAAIAGADFPEEHLALLAARGIDLLGLTRRGGTFLWEGLYEYDMNVAKTLKTELGSFATWTAELPDAYRDAAYVFLGNIDPDLQLRVLSQLRRPRLVVADTMNYWIAGKRERLLEVLGRATLLSLNEAEARQLFETANLIKAGRAGLEVGLQGVIIKKGEGGALLLTRHSLFTASSYPLESVVDPTGCGDSFGGAFIGYLARAGSLDPSALRQALVYGQIVASFCAEGFGTSNLSARTLDDVEARLGEFRRLTAF